MLINLRNALMAGKRLPYDAEVEFLESTGTGSTLAWVDTGIPNTANIRVEATARCVATSLYNTIDLYVFGSGWGANRGVAYGIVYSDFWTNLGKCMLLTRGGVGGSFSPDMGTSITGDGQFHYFVYETNDSMSSITVDNGTPFVITTPRNVNGQTYGVFGPRDNNTSSGIAQIAQLKIYDANGALVRDFIPVRKGTVGYLYDRVSGKLFGNAGTGDFVLGPDVVPVEYIESHGTEYIDTPWTPDLTTDLWVSGRAGFATTNRGMLLSAYNSGSPNNVNISFELYSDFYFRVYAYADVFSRFKCADSVKKMFDYSIVYTALNGLLSCTANGIERSGTVLTQSRVVNTLPARLGADYRAANRFGLFGPVKVYNPGLIFDFNPVRVGTGSTWEGAMIDVLTRRIYRNAGTGAFGYGNDLKYPIPAE